MRRYGARPAETRTEHTVHIAVQRDTAAIQAAERRLGWRVYGTNRPASALTLAQAVLAYRDEYLVERWLWPAQGAQLEFDPHVPGG